MFRGITSLNLDAKGRLAVPARYRDALLQQCDGQLVITINHEQRCLWVYPLDVWEGVERQLVDLPSLHEYPQRLKRLLIGYATECEVDGNGRVLVPPPLREYAKLNKHVKLVGQGNKFEIWDTELWDTETEAALSRKTDDAPMLEVLESLSL